MIKRQKKKRDWGKIFVILVLVAFIAPVGFLIYQIVVTGTADNAVGRSRQDYILMLLQCLLGIVALFVPMRLMRQLRIEIPRIMFLMYVGFLYCAIFLGEVRSFYYTVPHWDTILHTFSGAMLGALGFSMIALFNNTERIPLNLSPLFVAVFAFCFALALGGIWEIYEFSVDVLFDTNMQKFALNDGTPLMGKLALRDTMKDLIVDAIGAFVMSVVGYISLKYKKGWVEKLVIKTGMRGREKSKAPASQGKGGSQQ